MRLGRSFIPGDGSHRRLLEEDATGRSTLLMDFAAREVVIRIDGRGGACDLGLANLFLLWIFYLRKVE